MSDKKTEPRIDIMTNKRNLIADYELTVLYELANINYNDLRYACISAIEAEIPQDDICTVAASYSDGSTIPQDWDISWCVHQHILDLARETVSKHVQDADTEIFDEIETVGGGIDATYDGEGLDRLRALVENLKNEEIAKLFRDDKTVQFVLKYTE